MILSDRQITRVIEGGTLVVEPFDRENVQPASLDIRMGDTIRHFEGVSKRKWVPLDPRVDDISEWMYHDEDAPFRLDQANSHSRRRMSTLRCPTIFSRTSKVGLLGGAVSRCTSLLA